MANQFTKGTRKKHDESTKDKIRAELLAQRLYKFAKSKAEKREKLDMTPAQVAAAKVLIDRGKPALQAIEQTNINPMDAMSDEEIREQVKALITLHPWLLTEFRPGVQLQDDQDHGANAVVETPKRSAA